MAHYLEDDLSCPICQDIFKDPVVLTCSHSFCNDCLKRWWREKQTQECPLCKRRSPRRDPPRNLALKNVCEALPLQREQRSPAESATLCSLHSEKLKLFCLDHQKPVCIVCKESKTHKEHRFTPIDEAAQDHKEELQKSLKPLQEILMIFKDVKGNCDQTAEYIKVQARDTEKEIKEQFKKLRQFMKDEEEVEETVSFTPVILDPNTAHPHLILSEDLTSVRCGEGQKLPENPERNKGITVQGSEGFKSGKHSWDVEVGDNADWMLGVVNEFESWGIIFCGGEYRVVSRPDQKVVLQVRKKLQKIRVQLDFDGRKLSFSDLDAGGDIHTFTETFTGKLFPCIGSRDKLPIRILPEEGEDDECGDKGSDSEDDSSDDSETNDYDDDDDDDD
ncbi:E3 ubiquitin-protein ligase TRIM39-like [Scomber japonicus]|uniref:E3 ubiquitin-protein ligase TRIM39-like n=1 Tax=Scomber japonicus TaxID=13676 RepID=UPI002306415C|nr:E3 ubiquitin-protein ligase TRIM39-like [Scomber japonicus]